MTSAPTISFDYTPSRLLMAAVLAMLALAVMAALLAGLPLALRIGLAAAALAYAGISLRACMYPRWCAVGWRSDGSWLLRDRKGQEHAAELVTARVLGVLIVLTLRAVNSRTAALVLTPDNLDCERRRRLRMRLRAFTKAG